MVPDGQKVWTSGRNGRTDHVNSISLRLRRGIKRNSKHLIRHAIVHFLYLCQLIFVSGPKYIFWLILHNCAFWETNYSYTNFQNDGLKQWSSSDRDNQFKFISRVMTFTFMRR